MSENGMRTWVENAKEFGALVRQGKDVRLALLVACSVEPGSGHGGDRKSDQAREHVLDPTEKCSMGAFARVALGAETARDRVSRHFKAWARMAENNVVPAASTLIPADAVTFGEVAEDVQDKFAQEFAQVTGERPTGGRPRDSKAEDAAIIIEKRGAKAVVDALTTEQRQQLVEEAIKSDPAVAEVADFTIGNREPHDPHVVFEALASAYGVTVATVRFKAGWEQPCKRVQSRAERLAREGMTWRDACTQAATLDKQDDDTRREHDREERARKAEEASRPTPALFIIEAALRMANAGESSIAELSGRAFVEQFSDAELTELMRHCDRAQVALDYLRDTPNREDITVGAILRAGQ